MRIGHPARVLPSVLDHTLESIFFLFPFEIQYSLTYKLNWYFLNLLLVLIRNGDDGKLVNDIRNEMDSTLKSIQKTKKGESNFLHPLSH